ncbi:hypothetical protein BCR39DRAFT_503207 [Naematelia encephala]|uniref:Uncharacterized protein n=1 Tax=Naematelia encephala TaxID=71784 RepID=A0A1Y2BIR8_9TREE|nr:hypothetical protein BCR39DRAFT_503207 [Naematelia encephala]
MDGFLDMLTTRTPSPGPVSTVHAPAIPMYIESSDSENTVQEQLARGFPSTSTDAPIPTTAAMTDSGGLSLLTCVAPRFEINVLPWRSDATVSTMFGNSNADSSVAYAGPDDDKVTSLTVVAMGDLKSERLSPGTVTQLQDLCNRGSEITFHPEIGSSDFILRTLNEKSESDGRLQMSYRPSDVISRRVVVSGYFATAGNESENEDRVTCDVQFAFHVPIDQLTSTTEAVAQDDATQQDCTAII